MENKPFSIQAPEAIAKEYGGNKQKIASAVQMGIVDPTAALMAGMFIDRMRGAQMAEQAPQQTLAQKTFPQPLPPQQTPPVGLGSIPPQLAGAPQGAPSPQQQPGMADGGLVGLPLPDAMFNEESYAGGGIVAFADAGEVKANKLKTLMRIVSSPDSTSEERRAAMAELNGTSSAKNEGLKIAPPTDTPLIKNVNWDPMSNPGYGVQTEKQWYDTPTKGFALPTTALPKDPLRAGDRHPEYGPDSIDGPDASLPQFDVAGGNAPATKGLGYSTAYSDISGGSDAPRGSGPSSGGLGAIAPGNSSMGGGSRSRTSSVVPSGDPASVTPPTNAMTPADYAKQMSDYTGERPAPKYLEGEEGKLAKEKNEDLWTSLAQIGFGMAGSKSPYFLQAAGEAGSAAMPGMQKAIAAQREAAHQLDKDRYAYQTSQWGDKKDAFTAGAKLYGNEQDNQAKRDVANISGQYGLKEANIRAAEARYGADSAASRNPYVLGATNAVTAAGLDLNSKAGAKVFSDTMDKLLNGAKYDRNDASVRIAAEAKAEDELKNDMNYGKLQREDRKNGTRKADDYKQKAYNFHYRQLGLDSVGGNSSGGWKFVSAK